MPTLDHHRPQAEGGEQRGHDLAPPHVGVVPNRLHAFGDAQPAPRLFGDFVRVGEGDE